MNPTKPIVYVSGPITQGDRMKNVYTAMAVGHKLWEMGFEPHVPHLSHYWDERHPRSWQEWMDSDRTWVSVSQCMYRIAGPSKGADVEEGWAEREFRIPLFSEVSLGGRTEALAAARSWLGRWKVGAISEGVATHVGQVRPAVREFAVGMENRLRRHDAERGRRGWMHEKASDLLLHLQDEAGSLARLVRHGGDHALVNEEAFDTANMAMMVADVAGDLGPAADE